MLVPENAVLSGNANGKLMVFDTNGEQAICTNAGLIAMDGVLLTGDTEWKLKYDYTVLGDTNNIVTEIDGTAKTLTIATQQPNTNDQFFFNKDNQKALFFNAPIAGVCLDKAIKYTRIVKALLDNNGDPLLDNDGKQLYEN